MLEVGVALDLNLKIQILLKVPLKWIIKWLRCFDSIACSVFALYLIFSWYVVGCLYWSCYKSQSYWYLYMCTSIGLGILVCLSIALEQKYQFRCLSPFGDYQFTTCFHCTRSDHDVNYIMPILLGGILNVAVPV